MGIAPLTWRARHLGTKAKGLLATPGFSGEVLAALSGIAYLLGKGGEILWVAREGLPVHRRCILASLPTSLLGVGQSFFGQGSFLKIGSGVTIDLRQAKEWQSSVIEAGKAAPLTEVNKSVRQLLAMLPVPGSGEGLGQAILLISAIAEGRNLPAFPPSSLAAHAYPSILKVASACLNQELAQTVQISRELVGLGQGLTPSGDDFVGGLLFAAHCLERAYPGEFHRETEVIADLIVWAQTQTHPISHAILSDLSSGHGPEPLHDVMHSLIMGKNLTWLIAGANRLMGIGHSSGWDILTGVLTGMLLIRKSA